jgi:hypothetical protein
MLLPTSKDTIESCPWTVIRRFAAPNCASGAQADRSRNDVVQVSAKISS